MALEYFYKICLNLEKPSSIVFKVYRYKKCTCKMEGNVSLFWIEKFITIFHYQKFFSILFFFFFDCFHENEILISLKLVHVASNVKFTS